MRLDVTRYCSVEGHVSECEEKLDEAYRLGRSYAGWEAPELEIKCMVENCKGMFSSVEFLARHLAAAAGLIIGLGGASTDCRTGAWQTTSCGLRSRVCLKMRVRRRITDFSVYNDGVMVRGARY